MITDYNTASIEKLVEAVYAYSPRQEGDSLAEDMLVRKGIEAVLPLLRSIKLHSYSDVGLHLIVRIGASAMPVLIQALRDNTYIHALKAIMFLKIDDPQLRSVDEPLVAGLDEALQYIVADYLRGAYWAACISLLDATFVRQRLPQLANVIRVIAASGKLPSWYLQDEVERADFNFDTLVRSITDDEVALAYESLAVAEIEYLRVLVQPSENQYVVQGRATLVSQLASRVARRSVPDARTLIQQIQMDGIFKLSFPLTSQ